MSFYYCSSSSFISDLASAIRMIVTIYHRPPPSSTKCLMLWIKHHPSSCITIGIVAISIIHTPLDGVNEVANPRGSPTDCVLTLPSDDLSPCQTQLITFSCDHHIIHCLIRRTRPQLRFQISKPLFISQHCTSRSYKLLLF